MASNERRGTIEDKTSTWHRMDERRRRKRAVVRRRKNGNDV
jgi:hypothetical protein